MKKNIYRVLSLLLLGVLIFSMTACEKHPANGEISIFSLIGDGNSFGYAEWPFEEASEETIYSTTKTTEADWILDTYTYTLRGENDVLSISDMQEDFSRCFFNFITADRQQLIKYSIILMYKDRTVLEQDQEKLIKYVKEKYPNVEIDTASGKDTWICEDHTCCYIDRSQDLTTDGERIWALEIGVFKDIKNYQD